MAGKRRELGKRSLTLYLLPSTPAGGLSQRRPTCQDQLTSDALLRSPSSREAGNVADRFLEHSEHFFTFITTTGIEPTDNPAEQAIRFVAIHRRMTQGTRRRAGQTWCERNWWEDRSFTVQEDVTARHRCRHGIPWMRDSVRWLPVAAHCVCDVIFTGPSGIDFVSTAGEYVSTGSPSGMPLRLAETTA